MVPASFALRKRIAYDQGHAPTIDLINFSSSKIYSTLAFLRVMQKYANIFKTVWGTPCTLRLRADFTPLEWAIVFFDDADVENALGYHYVTPYNMPLSKVFVNTSRRAGEDPSITASHELAEMLVDPAINLWASNPDGTLWAWEVCDAVEATSFKIDGFSMSNFQYPAFFEGFRQPESARFDYLGLVSKPFSLLKGGYTLVWDHAGIYREFGSASKRKAFAKEDRRGHRSEYRLGPRGMLEPARLPTPKK